ncbi:nitroreductase family protein [Mycobacterium sp. pUA109]|uniref:nitroreductase family protein n=1 Tax=Mycobacterium sp. pUA109 TaxID=3238982 RepID=UPI00351B33F4
MPIADAMRTQRAIRRLHTDPVDWEVLREVLALALKAPTSSNSQDWAFIVVTDPEQKKRLIGGYQRMFKLTGVLRVFGGSTYNAMSRQWSAVEWQGQHFHELPVFVIPCYRRNMRHRSVGRPQVSVSSFYGSVYPAVQNILLACRAVGLGASLQTLPLWYLPNVRKVLGLPRSVVPVCLIPIGWARGRYGPTQRPPVEDVLHVERYGNQPFHASATDGDGRMAAEATPRGHSSDR